VVPWTSVKSLSAKMIIIVTRSSLITFDLLESRNWPATDNHSHNTGEI
jgi:hypothetical protein